MLNPVSPLFTTTYAENPHASTDGRGRREICGNLLTAGEVKFVQPDEFIVLRPEVDDKDRDIEAIQIQFNSQYGNIIAINSGTLTIITSENIRHIANLGAVPDPITDTVTFQLDNPLFQSPANQMNNWTYNFQLNITLFGGKQASILWSDERKSPFQEAEYVGRCCKSYEYQNDLLPDFDGDDVIYPVARLAAAYDAVDNMIEVDSTPSDWFDDCGNPLEGNSDRKVKWLFYLNNSLTPIHVLDFRTVNTTILGLGTSVHGALRFNSEDDVVSYLETETGLDIVDGDIVGMEILTLNCSGYMSIEVSNRIQFVHNCCTLALNTEDEECMLLESNLCILEESAV